MSPADVLTALLKSYTRYYNIETEAVEPPFAAEAAFHTHDEQFFLVKTAKLSEAEAHEYVFFAVEEELSLDRARQLDECAWQRGLSRARPSSYHRSTDVVLVILAERIAPDAKDYIKRLKRYQSYRFTFHGWSHYQAIALETSTGILSYNRRGRELEKLFRNINLPKTEKGK